MGIENRDYYKDDDRGNSVMSETPTVKLIIIVTVLFYLAQLFFVSNSGVRLKTEDGLLGFAPRQSVVEQWCSLETDKVLHGQVWRLITTALLHDRMGIWHIVMNMLALYWFGRSLELHYGSREFLIFYVAAALVASLTYVIIQLTSGDRAPAIGASGAVMAVFCLFAMWNPGYTVRIYFLFPIPIIWLLGLYVLYDLHPLIMQLNDPEWKTGVAHAAHLGGVAFGYLYYKRCWNLEKVVDRFLPNSGAKVKQALNRGSSSTAHPASRDDAIVDELLAKISQHGEASLTEREREILVEASERYRQRR
ncbi:MAG: rhomboid family intramembrane serine protease [Pirellulales bacterium]